MNKHYKIVNGILPDDLSEIVYNYMTIDKKTTKNNYDRLIRHFKRNMKFAVNYIYMNADNIYNCNYKVCDYVLLSCKSNSENSKLINSVFVNKTISRIDKYIKRRNRGFVMPVKRLIYSNDD